jgi:hypothetical protein
MDEGMNKVRFLEWMRSERDRWQALLSKIDEEQMERPGVVGNWSARELIVHVTAYERGLVEWLEAARRGEVKIFADLDHPDVDHRNEVILEESQGRSLEEIEAEAGRVFGRLMELVEAMPEEELVEAERVEWYVKPRWREQRALWECIADDSCRHYLQHMEDLRRWLEEERGSS